MALPILPRVFLSYAYDDDDRGWVTEFRNKLQERLDEACRERGLIKHVVFQDQNNLTRNQQFERELPQELMESRAFVALISKRFLASTWCGKEGHGFVNRLAGQFQENDVARDGIFVVDMDNTWAAARDPDLQLTGDGQTIGFIRQLRATIAGTYQFWAPLSSGSRGFRRICEPTYALTRDEDPDRIQYEAQIGQLVDQLTGYLTNVSRRLTASGIPKPHVLLVPPCRSVGTCWKDFVSLWVTLQSNSRLQLVPLPGKPWDGTSNEWNPERLAPARADALNSIEGSEIVVQLLGPMAPDWDPVVLDAAARMTKSAHKGPRLCVSSADLEGLQELIKQDNLIRNCVTASNRTDIKLDQLLRRPLFAPFSSTEDLARQISDLAASLSTHAPQSRNPVLIESTDDDNAMALEAQDELFARGIEYVNRRYFRDKDNKEIPLDDIEFSSVLYLCDLGASVEIVRRATQITRFLAATGRKAYRAALFYRPPLQGFRVGCTYAFDDDLAIPLGPTTDKRQALSTTIDKFLGP